MLNTKIGISYCELTRLICRVPLTNLTSHVLAFSARAPVPVLGTNASNLHIIFSLTLEVSDFRRQLELLLVITTLHRTYCLNFAARLFQNWIMLRRLLAGYEY